MSDELLAWLSVTSEVQMICTWPTDATAIPSSLALLKLRLVSPFWCQLTQAVLENRPLNRFFVILHILWYTHQQKLNQHHLLQLSLQCAEWLHLNECIMQANCHSWLTVRHSDSIVTFTRASNYVTVLASVTQCKGSPSLGAQWWMKKWWGQKAIFTGWHQCFHFLPCSDTAGLVTGRPSGPLSNLCH